MKVIKLTDEQQQEIRRRADRVKLLAEQRYELANMEDAARKDLRGYVEGIFPKEPDTYPSLSECGQYIIVSGETAGRT